MYSSFEFYVTASWNANRAVKDARKGQVEKRLIKYLNEIEITLRSVEEEITSDEYFDDSYNSLISDEGLRAFYENESGLSEDDL